MNQRLFDSNGKLCGPELDRRAALCMECMSETCAFNPEGVCTYPLLYGCEAEVIEDEGCLSWLEANETEA